MASVATDLYETFLAQTPDVVLDDRKERAGVKFNDADLIGYPVQVVVGKDTKTNGTVEVKVRRTGVKEIVPKEQAVARVQEILAELQAKNM